MKAFGKEVNSGIFLDWLFIFKRMKNSDKTTTLPLIPPSEERHRKFMLRSWEQWPYVAHPISWLLRAINHVVPRGNKKGPGHMGLYLLCDIMNHKRAMIPLSQWHNVDKPGKPETSDHTQNIYKSRSYLTVHVCRVPGLNKGTASIGRLSSIRRDSAVVKWNH